MNNRETLESFQSITGADEATARCFLESSNWNLEVRSFFLFLRITPTPAAAALNVRMCPPQAGISTFFDHGGVSPAAAVVTAPSLGKSDHTKKKKKTLYRSGSGGGWPAKYHLISTRVYLFSQLLLRVRSCVCVCGRDQWLMDDGDGWW
jgi:hypothetical protein